MTREEIEAIVVDELVARSIDEVQAVFVHTGADEQRLRQNIRQVLHRHGGIGAAQGVEIDMMRGGQVAAEVVFITAACVEHDGALGGVGVFDESLCFSY